MSIRVNQKNMTTEPIWIAQLPTYSIAVWPEKNRVHLTLIGFWRNPEVVPNYLQDWKKAISYTKKGFTLLTDASQMKTHPQAVRSLHEQAQGMVLKAGVSKVAEIIKDEVTEMQLDSVAKTTQFPKKSFKTTEEAMVWLDQE